jgi:hypothetical protein
MKNSKAYYLDLRITSKSQENEIDRKEISPNNYSIQHIEGHYLLCHKDRVQNSYSSMTEIKGTVLVQSIFIAPGIDKNRKLIRNTMTWSGFT